MTSCATHISKPAGDPVPSKVKFGEFKNVEMKSVKINEKFANDSANKRAVKKIEENLLKEMAAIFPNLKKIEEDKDLSKNDGRTLEITPYIKEIKFVSIATRFWFGSMAGSSAVLMKVDFVDSSTGEIIANPDFTNLQVPLPAVLALAPWIIKC